MLVKLIVLLFSLFSFGSAHAETFPVKLGDTTVVIEQIKHGSGKAFIHVHQTETTALEAARLLVNEEGGSVLTLHHPGARNIVFHLNHVRYEFDPNRMFTDVGIQKTLQQFGPYSAEAHQAVQALASRVTQLLPKNQRIIAVHNNKSYSLRDYYPGHMLASEVEALHVAAPQAYRNFYLVTQKADYSRLTQRAFNGVLQVSPPDDDGSLSVYLTTKPYVNVEAGYGQLAAQVAMLKAI